ncbi:MAG: hypothetical protein Q3990_03910 [Desulfovibrionaceae bacterium]|nr:hypothetical protein [Desulfovibrionaceae bacterium]
MGEQSDKDMILLWTGYVLLFLSAFVMYSKLLLLPGAAVLIGGYVARGTFRRQGKPLSSAHASWQINTVWLALLIFVAATIAVIAICAWMVSDPAVEARLDAIVSSNMTPVEMLDDLIDVPGVTYLATAVITFALLFSIWPLKRVLHGMIALKAGLEPAQLGTGRWIALVLAIAIQAIPLLVMSML